MLDKQRIRTFVLGGIAGALAGILLAPKSGKELRGAITSRAGEARERSRETYFEAHERMQERIARARERSLRLEETRIEGGAAANPLPNLGPAAPDPVLDPEPPLEAPPPTDPPPLRDASRDVPRPAFGEDPEELRWKVRETRSRLRARLNAPRSEDTPEGRDG